MARALNKVQLIGYLGADPDIRYLPNGKPVASFSLATTESWKDKQSGLQQEKTEWHRIIAFGKLAELAGEYARKGSRLYIEGRLQTRKWTDQNQIERYTTEVVLDLGGQLLFLDNKVDGNQSGVATGNSNAKAASPQKQQQPTQNTPQEQPQEQPPLDSYDNDRFDDDIPF